MLLGEELVFCVHLFQGAPGPMGPVGPQGMKGSIGPIGPVVSFAYVYYYLM